MHRRLYLILTITLLTSTCLISQKKKWNVADPPGTFKDLKFSTDEGTWMSLDVSPDGKEIVFDLLGDIYIMPVQGGTAKLLRGGLPYEVQPRFSPDGKKIAFTSDAGGGDNIWIMDKDGSEAKQITKESFRLLNNPVWNPDGQYLVARKHFTSQRSLGAGEMWLYHINGGSGIQLTKRKNDQQDVNEPNVSSDGRYVYFSEDVYPGGFFQYNKDPNKQIYVIKRLDRETGKIKNVVSGSGGASRPQISHDGNTLAFIKRVREKTVLFLRDLRNGEQWPVYDGLSKDQQEAWAIFGTYPGFSWTPDDKHIVIWSKGKINKIDISNGSASIIPFTAEIETKIAEALKFKQKVAPETFNVKVIRHAVTSPDEKTLIFNAAGYLWKKKLPNGTPKRLTNSIDYEFEPDFSPDGKHLVYVTWNDEGKGTISKLDLTNSKANPIQLSSEKGIYRTPRFSPDGSKIVYQRERGNIYQGTSFSEKPGLYFMSSNGGASTFVCEEGAFPRFNHDGTRIYFQKGGNYFGSLTKTYTSIKLDGGDQKDVVKIKYANDIVPSPDGKWIAFTELFKAYIAPMPATGKVLELSASSKAIPVSQVARDAGINLHWSSDSKKLHWTIGEEYFTNEINQRFTFLENSPDSVANLDTVGIKVGLKLKSDVPEGTIALKGATIITMNEDEVIQDGTIIIEGNKIKVIGNKNQVTIPRNAKVVDVQGKTIMPGLIDVHAHLGTFRYGLSPQKHWPYYANLAYGVTTTHDPSSNTEMVFSQSEMIKAGHMVGPRIYSTGIIIYGADGDFKAVINNLDDARSALRRTKAFGAFSIKSYNQPRREQRQQVIQAARELEMMVYPEGGSTFFHNMSMILDGHTGIEHNIPIAPLYNDVIQLWSASKTGYTPTLIVNYAGMSGEYYWYQTTNVWEKETLLNFTPRSIIDSRARHRTMVPLKEYDNGHILTSESCKKLADAGVKVNLGAHGQLQGLGAHWELWMLAQGGMTNMEALKAATINGAVYLGMEDEIGSLEIGKLADLIVLDANPLENIQNTENVKYTMINGRLYDTQTMNEIGNHDKKRTKFFWENDKYGDNFDWHEESQSFGLIKCSCQSH
ncbi:amidohydrolase family protein [Fulvivirgaceae bacterium BMA10]|uniref:Amidohydrolase family protein n=1 Tax=Splendidivirga corallicola TaxID=3051826 RepID=A0ABT8KLH2_9BACT|nr:amidohydrolase family protein [Fulvivirgaceae bacterium BMA10]